MSMGLRDSFTGAFGTEEHKCQESSTIIQPGIMHSVSNISNNGQVRVRVNAPRMHRLRGRESGLWYGLGAKESDEAKRCFFSDSHLDA